MINVQETFIYNNTTVDIEINKEFRGYKYSIDTNVVKVWRSIGFTDSCTSLSVLSNWVWWLETDAGVKLSGNTPYSYQVINTTELAEYDYYFNLTMNTELGHLYKLLINGGIARNPDLNYELEPIISITGVRCFSIDLTFFQPIEASFVIVNPITDGSSTQSLGSITPTILQGAGAYQMTLDEIDGNETWDNISAINNLNAGTHLVSFRSQNNNQVKSYQIILTEELV